MDLRIVKTRKIIRQAFLELRVKYPLEKIKVSRLCQLAQINKTTFYKHYQDIYALSDEIENILIDAILNSFERINDLFSETEGFMRDLYEAFKSNEEEIMTLFSGRMNILIDKVEKRLTTHYPSIRAIPEKEIALSFIILGASHVLSEGRYEETVVLKTLPRVVKHIIHFIDQSGDEI